MVKCMCSWFSLQFSFKAQDWFRSSDFEPPLHLHLLMSSSLAFVNEGHVVLIVRALLSPFMSDGPLLFGYSWSWLLAWLNVAELRLSKQGDFRGLFRPKKPHIHQRVNPSRRHKKGTFFNAVRGRQQPAGDRDSVTKNWCNEKISQEKVSRKVCLGSLIVQFRTFLTRLRGSESPTLLYREERV